MKHARRHATTEQLAERVLGHAHALHTPFLLTNCSRAFLFWFFCSVVTSKNCRGCRSRHNSRVAFQRRREAPPARHGCRSQSFVVLFLFRSSGSCGVSVADEVRSRLASVWRTRRTHHVVCADRAPGFISFAARGVCVSAPDAVK